MGPIAFFSNFILRTSSRKHLEGISHDDIVSLVYKLLTSGGGSWDLSTGFGRDGGGRRDQLTNNKNIKGNYQLRIIKLRVCRTPRITYLPPWL